jgi:hypothetical protein
LVQKHDAPAFSEGLAICLALVRGQLNGRRCAFGLPFWRCWTIDQPV